LERRDTNLDKCLKRTLKGITEVFLLFIYKYTRRWLKVYNTAFNGAYTPQMNIDRINTQISELERMKNQYVQQANQPQPTNLTQNFQLAPVNREVIRYANSIEDVQKDIVIGETPYFSKDMTVVWIKNVKGDIKTYELTEIIAKDEKDLKIEFLQAQIEELKKGMRENAKPDSTDVVGSVESTKSTSISNSRKSNAKPKQSY
jgi:hypothetical protein